MQCNCMMGLFPEISRAWLTIDSDIFDWNYEDRWNHYSNFYYLRWRCDILLFQIWFGLFRWFEWKHIECRSLDTKSRWGKALRAIIVVSTCRCDVVQLRWLLQVSSSLTFNTSSAWQLPLTSCCLVWVLRSRSRVSPQTSPRCTFCPSRSSRSQPTAFTWRVLLQPTVDAFSSAEEMDVCTKSCIKWASYFQHALVNRVVEGEVL